MAKKDVIKGLGDIKKVKRRIKIPELKMDIINSLAEEGQRLINLAYERKGFQDRTGNLRDSYVSAVFYNGHLMPNTICYLPVDEKDLSKSAVEFDDLATGDREYGTGREEALRFLHKWGFSKGRPGGIQLVIAAAMFYSGIVESHGYSVLANIELDVQDVIRRGFSASKYLAHIRLDEITKPSIYREDGKGRMQVIN
jgi:hypothetical protein